MVVECSADTAYIQQRLSWDVLIGRVGENMFDKLWW